MSAAYSNSKNASSEGRLVYSTDPALNRRCVKCHELESACTCPTELGADAAKASKFFAILRIEKQGRGGKAVTVIDNLPKSEVFLKDLTKKLKNQCGAGGTYRMDGKEGLIEIQGERKDQIRQILEKLGMKVKG